MKKLFLVLCAVLLCFMVVPSVSYAESPTVTVCGESATGNQSEALNDARKKAVGRVLSKMILPNQDPGSLFQKILARYKEFTSEPKISEKRTDGKSLYLISRVVVDAKRLHETVESETRKSQDKNMDAEACFLIRIEGLPSNLSTKGWQIVHMAYNDSFEQLGFRIADSSDELSNEIENIYVSSYEDFCQKLMEKIKSNHPEITVAVIGKIVTNLEQNDETGVLVHADVKIRSVDMVKEHTIADFADAYEMKRMTEQEAQTAVLFKVALNSAPALADKTLAYWKAQ